MARIKNALRGHFVAPYTPGTEVKEVDYLELAKWITEITDDSDENVEEYADYAGDGNPTSDITSIAEKWSVTGTYDHADEAQALIAGMKRKIGDERKLWHKIVETNGDVWEGLATAVNIKAGSGPAEEFEEFSCGLNYDGLPTKSSPAP